VVRVLKKYIKIHTECKHVAGQSSEGLQTLFIDYEKENNHASEEEYLFNFVFLLPDQ
jgi:hypothetical protein